jgi:hypothetical protein
MIDYVRGLSKSMSREKFDAAVSAVKGQCKAAVELLISQLEKRFPNSKIMEALGIVFPQYWVQEKCDELFPLYLQVIKDWFCNFKVANSELGVKGSYGKLLHLWTQRPLTCKLCSSN